MGEQKYADKQIYRVFINAPIDVVWSELVNTTSPRPFFFGAVCDTPGLEPGAPYRMITKNGKYASVAGKVLEMEPPHRLVQSFKFTTMNDAPCKVSYILKEKDGGTEFSLITENVPANSKTEKSMVQGGDFITRNLKSWVENGKPTFGGVFILLMIGLMQPLTPKVARTENWPFEALE